MDIDNQDELLVEYDDGDAPMGVDATAEVIIVDEGDAEMLDEMENLDDNDTSMLDDTAIAMTLASTTVIVVDETEIDMRPAEEEIDDDTPMREDVPEENNGISATEDYPITEPTPASKTESWPPAPTDVPPVPSLLPSALAVPQESQHEEGKIHDGAVKTSSPPSVIAEAADASSDPLLEPTNPRLTTLTREAEDTESNAVEPAFSVRGSDMGTINEERNGTITAATSVHGGDTVEPENGNEAGKWPPAPTEVPAVPSMLPSALAVPDAVTEEAGGREQIRESSRGKEASVVAEPAGSVGANEVSLDVAAGVEGAGEATNDDAGENTNGVAKEKMNGDVSGENVGSKEQETVETGQAEDDLTAEDSKADIDPSQSDDTPIVLVISDTIHQPLFAPLPSDLEYESDEPVGPPILAGMAVDVYGAALSEVFQGLRDALAHGDDAFSVKRGKELVLEQQELSLRVGEDNKYAGEITLKEIVQLYRDCNGLAPMVLHLHHDSPRFIEWYKMTRAFADNLQLQQREEHDGSEYDEHEEGDIHEDGDGNDDDGEDSAEIDEGETVYVDAQEDDLDVEVEVEDYELDEEEPQQSGDIGEAEEDELALDNSDGVVVASVDQLSVKQADRAVTEEIVEYEEDELVIIEAPAVENVAECPEEDQFGVDAAIRAAEQEAGATAAAAIESTIPESAAKSEDSMPTKRSRDADGEPSDAERQVKRKLSDAGDAAVSQVPNVVTDGGEVLEETS